MKKIQQQNKNEQIRAQLEAWAEPKLSSFSAGLIPGEKCVLGVRLPKLRSYAKELAKGDWRAYLANAKDDSMEEAMLQGMTLGYIKEEFAVIEPYLTAFIPKITNWSVCDSTCASLKVAKSEPEPIYQYLLHYLHASGEYEIRFAVVMLLNHYMNDTYLELILAELDQIHHEGYYVKMAVAWNLSYCYMLNAEKTLDYLIHSHIDDWTYNKAIQKMIESRQISEPEKDKLRAMKRKKINDRKILR